MSDFRELEWLRGLDLFKHAPRENCEEPSRRLVARVRNDQIRWRDASVEGGQLLAMLIDPSIAKQGPADKGLGPFAGRKDAKPRSGRVSFFAHRIRQ